MKITLHSNEPISLSENVLVSTIIVADKLLHKPLVIPGVFDLSSISHFTFNRPGIQRLKSELIPRTITYKEARELTSKSKIQLKDKNPNELEPFIKRLFQLKLSAIIGLEKIFAGNTKIGHLIKSIKKQYE